MAEYAVPGTQRDDGAGATRTSRLLASEPVTEAHPDEIAAPVPPPGANVRDPGLLRPVHAATVAHGYFGRAGTLRRGPLA